jgi:hypothetical protein
MMDKDIIIGPCIFILVGIGPWLDKHDGPCMLVVVKRAVVVCACYQILLAFIVMFFL